MQMALIQIMIELLWEIMEELCCLLLKKTEAFLIPPIIEKNNRWSVFHDLYKRNFPESVVFFVAKKVISYHVKFF